MNRFILILSVGLSMMLMACGSDDKRDFNAENDAEILEYIADNNLDAIATGSGLYYVVEKEGDGNFPDLTNQVTVHYHGTLTNGNVFDSSIDSGSPISFPLTGVILGWQEGIPKFSRGGKGKLIIPSRLGYGSNSVGSIPSYSVLIFDVELLDF